MQNLARTFFILIWAYSSSVQAQFLNASSEQEEQAFTIDLTSLTTMEASPALQVEEFLDLRESLLKAFNNESDKCLTHPRKSLRRKECQQRVAKKRLEFLEIENKINLKLLETDYKRQKEIVQKNYQEQKVQWQKSIE